MSFRVSPSGRRSDLNDESTTIANLNYFDTAAAAWCSWRGKSYCPNTCVNTESHQDRETVGKLLTDILQVSERHLLKIEPKNMWYEIYKKRIDFTREAVEETWTIPRSTSLSEAVILMRTWMRKEMSKYEGSVLLNYLNLLISELNLLYITNVQHKNDGLISGSTVCEMWTTAGKLEHRYAKTLISANGGKISQLVDDCRQFNEMVTSWALELTGREVMKC